MTDSSLLLVVAGTGRLFEFFLAKNAHWHARTTHKKTSTIYPAVTTVATVTMQTVLRSSARALLSTARYEAREAGIALPSSSSFLSSTSFGSDADTHDDFKPKAKSGASSSVDDVISADVKSHNVFLYMKGVPTQPMCGFSNMAARILDAYGVEYGSRDVLSDPELREGIKAYTAWPTIPQIFIEGEFVGGSDILMEMHQSGELEQKLSKYMK